VLTTLEFAPDEAPSKIAEEVRAVFRSSKVIHIRGPKPEGDLRDYYWSFFEKVGEPLPLAEDVSLGDRDQQRTGSYWAEVRYDPTIPNAYRHSANAQPLHTDGSYISSSGLEHEVSPTAVGTGFLGCVAMSDNGGATTFIDAVDLVEVLRAENSELLERLQGMEVPHARSGDRKVAKVIRYEGDVPLVNWNYYCVDPEAGEAAQRLREDFFAFLQTSPGVAANLKRVKLSPGDAVLWKDDFVLHGRDAFDPEKPSDRFLWKTGLLIDA
jgi:alpha-ketoglutarate-dependent taurine dioxygenase